MRITEEEFNTQFTNLIDNSTQMTVGNLLDEEEILYDKEPIGYGGKLNKREEPGNIHFKEATTGTVMKQIENLTLDKESKMNNLSASPSKQSFDPNYFPKIQKKLDAARRKRLNLDTDPKLLPKNDIVGFLSKYEVQGETVPNYHQAEILNSGAKEGEEKENYIRLKDMFANRMDDKQAFIENMRNIENFRIGYDPIEEEILGLGYVPFKPAGMKGVRPQPPRLNSRGQYLDTGEMHQTGLIMYSKPTVDISEYKQGMLQKRMDFINQVQKERDEGTIKVASAHTRKTSTIH